MSSPTHVPAPIVRKAIIPICTPAEQLSPASRGCPPCLMPMVDGDGAFVNVLHCVLEEALRALQGDEKDMRLAVVLDSQRLQSRVQEYFGGEDDEQALTSADKQVQTAIRRLCEIGKLIDYIVKPSTEVAPLTSGSAVLLCAEWAGNEPFLVLQGDRLFLSEHPRSATINCARQLVDCFAHFGGNGADSICIAVQEVEPEEEHFSTLVAGPPIVGVDLYASHAELQRQIAAQHLQHGLDLAALQLQAEGVSRFTRGPISPPPPELMQGDLYRLTKLAITPSPAAAQEFRVPRPAPAAKATSSVSGYPDFAAASRAPLSPPAHTFLSCMDIDLLGPTIFPVLRRMQDEIEAESSAATAATVVAAVASNASDNTVAASASSPTAADASMPSILPAPAVSSTSGASVPRKPLQLRAALSSLLSTGVVAVYGLRVLGQRFDVSQPLLYAHALQAFVNEAADRQQTKADAEMIIPGPQAKLGVIGSPNAQQQQQYQPHQSQQQEPSPVAVKLSNAALPKRAVYD